MIGTIKHYNSSITSRLLRKFNFKGSENVENQVLSYITPTQEMHATIKDIRNSNKTVTGTTTLFTVPNDKDYYLEAFNFALTKDVVCDNVLMTISATPDGRDTSVVLLGVPSQTTTVFNDSGNFLLPDGGIKLKRGTTITCAATFTVGAFSAYIVTIGHFEEVTK